MGDATWAASGKGEKFRARQRSDLGRVDKIEIFVIPAKAGIYEDVYQVIIGLKTPGFRFKDRNDGVFVHTP